jgi:hypothetical protein
LKKPQIELFYISTGNIMSAVNFHDSHILTSGGIDSSINVQPYLTYPESRITAKWPRMIFQESQVGRLVEISYAYTITGTQSVFDAFAMHFPGSRSCYLHPRA